MSKIHILEKIYKTFLENRIVSRWFVLIIELTIVGISTVISYYIIDNIYKNIPGIEHPRIHEYMLCSISVSLFYFIICKTYKGIIRYSTVHEFNRCFIALICSTTTIFFYLYFGGAPSGSISTTFSISFLLFSLLGLFFFRIMVIFIFRFMQIHYSGKNIEVYLWGVNEDTISMSQILNSSQSQYSVKGFIEEGKSTKLIKNTNLPVLKKDWTIIEKKVENVLFLNQNDLKENRNGAERLLKLGKKIYTMQDINIGNINDLLEISHNIRPIQIEDLLGRPEIETSTKSIFNSVNGKTILVSGAAGSIGSEIVRQLANYNPKLVVCLDQAETPLHTLALELGKININFEVIIGDIRQINKLSRIFDKYCPDIVYHAAAYKHVPLMEEEPCEAILTNVKGTKNLVDLSIQYNVETFILISTDKAVNPTNIMGASKRIAEIYAQTCALDKATKNSTKTKFITTRFGNVLGSNGSVIPIFKKQIQKGGPITVTHKDITRYFMTIPEACRLVLEASVIGKSGYIYIFDMGEPVRIYDLAEKIIELSGLRPHKDIKIEVSGLRPGEKLYEELLNNQELVEETSHKKIKVAKVRQYVLHEVLPKINNIIELGENYNIEDLVRSMKDLVPEFKSKNSKFEIFDKEEVNL